MLSRLNFITILLIVFVDYLGLGLVYPVFAALFFDSDFPIFAIDFSTAYRGAILGLLISLTPLTQFFCSPILGLFSDFFGRKRSLIYGMTIGCAGYLLAVFGIFYHSLSMLILYRICVGISEGTVGVAQAMVADISTEENKARRFGLFSASAGIGFMIGPFLGGKLADPNIVQGQGYALPFIVAGIMCLINLLLICFQFSETRKKREDKTFNLLQGLDNIRKVFLWEKLRWVFLAAFALAFGWSFFNEFIPLLLKERFGFNPSDVGNYYAYGGAWYAISAGLGTAPLLKYFPADKLVTKALLVCGACMLGFIIVHDSQYIWWILPPFMYFLAASFPTTAAITSNHATTENQGEVLGVYQSVLGAAMGLSPLLAGSIVGVYPELTAWGGSLAMFIASGAFWMACRSKSNQVLQE